MDSGWRTYMNGNIRVIINTRNGMKIRMTDDDEFSADFPESIDMKITDRCNIGCVMCHEGSTEHGKHADPDAEFLDTLRPYTETAIGGGAVTEHPRIDSFLKDLKERNVLSNLAVHEKELSENKDRLQGWIDRDLVKGIGVSVRSPSNRNTCDFADLNTNTVLHAIAGMTPLGTIMSYADRNMKILILGYKIWGRGARYYCENDESIKKEIKNLENNLNGLFDGFDVVSFDNLALRQLNVREHTDDDVWNACYQGSDATHTMYVDLVRREFAATSTSEERYPIMSTIDEMFAKVKGTMNQII